MKKLVSLILIIGIIACAGCGKKEVTENPDSKPAVTKPKEPEVKKDDFVLMMEKDTRPIAVMIDNDGESSRPQIGLEDAYMLYEIIVEGGASRIMALFKDASKIEKVGPVRSSRHYFLDYALEHDAIYCHAGWSPRAQADISSLGVNNINGILGNDGSNFYRDYTYDKSWHNLYTDLNKVYEYGTDKKNYRSKTEKTHTAYNDTDTDIKDGTSATEIVLPYSTMYKVTYKYNPDTKTYTRYIGSREHMSQTGNALTAKNIIIYSVRNYDLADGENKGRQDIVNIGSGNGYYVTNGAVREITWSKEERTGKTVYKYMDGSELKLNPGNTYVQIMPLTSEITIN